MVPGTLLIILHVSPYAIPQGPCEVGTFDTAAFRTGTLQLGGANNHSLSSRNTEWQVDSKPGPSLQGPSSTPVPLSLHCTCQMGHPLRTEIPGPTIRDSEAIVQGEAHKCAFLTGFQMMLIDVAGPGPTGLMGSLKLYAKLWIFLREGSKDFIRYMTQKS